MRVFYNDGSLLIRSMLPEDAKVLYDTYLSYGWHPKIETYESYYRDQQQGNRIVLIPELQGVVKGQCTLDLHPTEGPFGGREIPEIVDLTVFFDSHCRGIGNRLLDAAEAEAAKVAELVYLAVGLHSGYGPAQRIYARRGYLPDGSGVWYRGKVLEPYTACCNDDELLLYLSKRLR